MSGLGRLRLNLPGRDYWMPRMKRGMTTERFLAGSATMASVKMRLPVNNRKFTGGFFSRRLKRLKSSLRKKARRGDRPGFSASFSKMPFLG
jgi:hypothetical protein